MKVLEGKGDTVVDDKPTRNQNVENVFSGFHHCRCLGVYSIHIS